jgi:hypothetical protein
MVNVLVTRLIPPVGGYQAVSSATREEARCVL